MKKQFRIERRLLGHLEVLGMGTRWLNPSSSSCLSFYTLDQAREFVQTTLPHAYGVRITRGRQEFLPVPKTEQALFRANELKYFLRPTPSEILSRAMDSLSARMYGFPNDHRERTRRENALQALSVVLDEEHNYDKRAVIAI